MSTAAIASSRASAAIRVRELAGPIRRWQGTAPLVAALITFIVGVYRITGPEVWYDETATITSASRSWSQLFFEARHIDAVHTFYYAIMHVVFDVFGYSPFTLRAPSALAIGIAAAFTVVLAREFGNPRRAFLAGVILCLIPRTIWAAGEGRSYAGTAMLAVILTWLLVRGLRSARRRWWVFYAIVAFLACLLFAFETFLILAHALTVALYLVRERRAALRSSLGWFIAATVAGVALIPFVLVVRHQSAQIGWIGPFYAPRVLDQVYFLQWFSRHAAIETAVMWVLFLIGCVVALWKTRSLSLGSVAVPAALVPTMGMVAFTILRDPIYNDRYVTMCVPFVAILIACALPTRGRWIFACIGAVVVLAILFIPGYSFLRSTYANQASNWLGAVADVQRQRALLPIGSTTGVIWGPAEITHHHPQQIMQWAYPRAFDGMVNVTIDQSGAQRGQLWQSQYPLADSFGRLKGITAAFYISGLNPQLLPEVTRLMSEHGWTVFHRWTSTDIQVDEFTQSTSQLTRMTLGEQAGAARFSPVLDG